MAQAGAGDEVITNVARAGKGEGGARPTSSPRGSARPMKAEGGHGAGGTVCGCFRVSGTSVMTAAGKLAARVHEEVRQNSRPPAALSEWRVIRPKAS